MENKERMYLMFCVYAIFNAVISMPNLKTEWEEWKFKYGKVYDNDKIEKEHMEIWKGNYRYVQEHNKQGGIGFMVELNSFADQNYKRNIKERRSILKERKELSQSLIYVPAEWDWRTHGVICPVQNQGQGPPPLVQIIVTAECVQSYGAIETGKLSNVSEVEVAECCVPSDALVGNVFMISEDCVPLSTIQRLLEVVGIIRALQ